MKLYISADIEGIAGVVSRDQGSPEAFEYDKGREWMTAEVLAACEAAYDKGVNEIVVSDSHGNGQNLLLDELPDYVSVVRSWPRPLGMMQGIEQGGFTAAMLIGYHAGASNMGGILAHTLNGLVIREIQINGCIVSEAGISAAIAGYYKVPVILISGDDSFVNETTEFLNNVETLVTKTSYGSLSGCTITPRLAGTLMREKVAAAIDNLDQFSPHTVSDPTTLRVNFKQRMPAEMLAYLPMVKRIDAYSVEYVGPNIVELSKFLTFITSYQPTVI